MVQFFRGAAASAVESVDQDEKTSKRRHQESAKQFKRMVAATFIAIVIGSCLAQKVRTIVAYGGGAERTESRSLRTNGDDSAQTNKPTTLNTHVVPGNAVDLSPAIHIHVALPKSAESLPDTGTWPSTDLLDGLFAPDTPISQRRLVVAAANIDFVDFADNFATSLLKLNVTNFVLVPLDGEASRVLHEAYPKHTVQVVPGLESKNLVRVKGFGSKEFKELTSTRPLFLKSFLEKGYTIFYNDVDMVWTQNAWDAIDKLNNKDTTGMLWHDGPGILCSCLLYLLPTPESLLLLTKWQDEIATDQHKNDQPALNKVAQDMGISARNEKNATVQVFKNSVQFPNGRSYFGKRYTTPSEETVKNRVHAVIVHNNWISGKERKIGRYEEVGLWNPSGRL